FLLTTMTLFVRPADFVPSLENLPIYNVLILAALLASMVPVVKLFNRKSLQDRPYILGVIALLPAIMLSHLSHRDLWDARLDTIEFSKVVVYFLLLIAVVDSPRRLRYLLVFLTLCIAIITILSLLQHHGFINMEGLAGCSQWIRNEGDSGQIDYVIRLQGPGIFHDPNDLSLILVMGIVLCTHFLLENRNWASRLTGLLAIGTFFYALMLTQSRGGFLSLLAGLYTLIFYRWGWRKSLFLGAILVPALVFVMRGRETQIDLTDPGDTAQSRILIWRDSLVIFHGAPIFGIGYNKLGDEIGHVAHNSYVQAYAELGLIGGTIFVGLFYVLIAGVQQIAVSPSSDAKGLLSLRPYILAILWATAVGLFSLTRCYSLPTYVVFGIAAVFCVLAGEKTGVSFALRGYRLYRNIALASIGCLILVHAFVKILA
ncbi:MAG TPA: O-antigen ligase family protein, partial [Humisphaera sp.]|nr:O-antigen ligase family protein [Humisphaera sp.]